MKNSEKALFAGKMAGNLIFSEMDPLRVQASPLESVPRRHPHQSPSADRFLADSSLKIHSAYGSSSEVPAASSSHVMASVISKPDV